MARRREAAAVQPARAEPDHVLFPVNDFERQVRPDLDHDHVDRVGADVDGGYAHAEGGAGLSRQRLVPLHGRYILAGRPTVLKNPCQLGKSYHEPCASRLTRLLLERPSRALKRHLPAAIEGDGIGVHQARVASRRLREAVPVLAADVKPSKARQSPAARSGKLTRALGTVRELDVTLTVLDELAERGTLPRSRSRKCAPTWSRSASIAGRRC